MKAYYEKRSHAISLKRSFWIFLIIWTGLIAASLYWDMLQSKNEIREVARTFAIVAIEKDILYRRWSTRHGGLYAPVTEKTEPNPYLKIKERDIQTPSGKRLTLINPAYMTRQVHEMAMFEENVLGHITSLNPIRPKNSADPWETEALKAFERGLKEVSSIVNIKGIKYIRLMKPLITEEGCLKCHAEQGYQLNDIRGGISVSLPISPLLKTGKALIKKLALAHFLLWIVGVFGIAYSRSRLTKQIAQRLAAEAKHKESEARYRALFDSAGDAILLMDKDKIIECNPKTLILFNCSKEEILNKSMYNFSPPQQPDGSESKSEITRKLNAVTKGKIQFFEWVHSKCNGKTFSAEVTLNQINLKTNIFLQATIRDVSQRKKAEDEKAWRERLQGVIEMSGAVCHELNQPLQVISGYSELMFEDIAKENPLYNKISKIKAEVDRVTKINRKLMKITRYETKAYAENVKIIDIDKSSTENP